MHEVEPGCMDTLGWLSPHTSGLSTCVAPKRPAAGAAEEAWGRGPGDPRFQPGSFTVDFGVYYLTSLGLGSLKLWAIFS